MDTLITMSHRNVLECMPFGVIQVDPKGIVMYANKAAFDLLGICKEDELIGKHYTTFPMEAYGEERLLKPKEHALYAVLNEQEAVGSSIQGALVNERKRWFSVNAAPVYDDDNSLTGGVCNIADITDKVIGEEHHQLEADRYKILLENIDAVVWERDLGIQSFSYISPRVEELLGFPPKDWGKEGFWYDRIHEEDRPQFLEIEEGKAAKHGRYQIEYRMLHKNGHVVWVRDLVEVVKEKGKAVKLRGVMVNITERKNSQSLLKETEGRYTKMISEAPYAVTIYDRTGTLIAANERCVDFWMMDPEKWVGNFNIFKNDIFTSEAQVDSIQKAFRGERGEVTAEIPLTHIGESKKTYRLKYFPLFDSEGELDNVIYFTEDITEYVNAQKKAKEGESLKQGILDALNEAILVIDKDGLVISINETLIDYIRDQPYAELEVGRSVFDFIKFFDEGPFLREELTSILEGKAKVIDHEMKLADGKWYNLRTTPLKAPFGAVITWQNINTRKEIEMALERSLKKYRNIYNRAPVMMHSMNDKLEIISVSDFWLDKMGYQRNEVIGRSPVDFMDDDSKKKTIDSLKQLFKEGEVRNIEYKFVKKSGEVIDVILSAVAEYDELGNFERSITGMLDVTDLKVAERQLQESQFKLLEAQKISKIANYEYDIQSGDLTPSNEMISMMGFSGTELNISVLDHLIHPEDLEEFKAKLQRSIEEGRSFYHIYRIHHLRTRKIKWITGRGKIIRGSDGRLDKMIGTVQDISEQKQAEQKIKRLTDRILLATEIANLGVWEYDRELDQIFWEDQMYAIFEDVKKPFNVEGLKPYLSDSNKHVIEDSTALMRKGVNFFESDFQIEVNGKEKYLRAFTRVLRDSQSKMKGMVGVIYDITSDKKLQTRLESSLEEKNVLIKEVHHRVKNNMQLISSILALKSFELKDDQSKVIFNEVNERIKSMSVIHDKLYTFYNVSEIDIGTYLDHIAKELQMLQGTASVIISVSSESVILDVEKALLVGLMVSEMVGNALKHGFEDGQKGHIHIQFGMKDGMHVLKVSNDGNKIEKGILESTSGLGVSLVKTFVKQLRGTVEVDSSENGFIARF